VEVAATELRKQMHRDSDGGGSSWTGDGGGAASTMGRIRADDEVAWLSVRNMVPTLTSR
jgi:hypothetical protein